MPLKYFVLQMLLTFSFCYVMEASEYPFKIASISVFGGLWLILATSIYTSGTQVSLIPFNNADKLMIDLSEKGKESLNYLRKKTGKSWPELFESGIAMVDSTVNAKDEDEAVERFKEIRNYILEDRNGLHS